MSSSLVQTPERAFDPRRKVLRPSDKRPQKETVESAPYIALAIRVLATGRKGEKGKGVIRGTSGVVQRVKIGTVWRGWKGTDRA